MIINDDLEETSISLADVEEDLERGNTIVTHNPRHPYHNSDKCVETDLVDKCGEDGILFNLPNASRRDTIGHTSNKSFRSFGSSDDPHNDSDSTHNNIMDSSGLFPTRWLWRSILSFFLLLQVIFVLLSFLRTQPLYILSILPLTGCAGVVFFLYDLQRTKQEESLQKVVHQNAAIVDSLFPEIVRDRIMAQENLLSSTPKMRNSKNLTTSKNDLVETEQQDQDSSDCSYSQSPDKNFTETLSSTSRKVDKLLVSSARRLHSFVSNASSSTFSTHPSSGFVTSSASNENEHKESGEKSVNDQLPVTLVSGPSVYPDPSSFKRNRKDNNSSNNSNSCSLSSDASGERCGSSHNQFSSLHPSGSFYSQSSLSSTSKPIADYFPSATIMFADIVGFTSWASIRDPAQVFELLETLYGRFDEIARNKGVFKVETIGDCYVAATGLPSPRKDHAVVMASFARRCLESMMDTVSHLEASLGPGTEDLGMRIGIHSGNVIGGVLRGAKSRYQLFGDTMNTASRIESSSEKNKIHLSEQTAQLLTGAGKKVWVEPRTEKIIAKGKGQLQTYWLSTEGPKNLSDKEKLALPALLKMMAKADIDPGFIKQKKVSNLEEKIERLVDYHTNILKIQLTKLNEIRSQSTEHTMSPNEGPSFVTNEEKINSDNPVLSLNECIEGITFPTATLDTTIYRNEQADVLPVSTLDNLVLTQLRQLVSKVSRVNSTESSFGMFEESSHRVLSISKLMAGIETDGNSNGKRNYDRDLIQNHFGSLAVYNKTKSMIAHPISQFVVVFGALLHYTYDKRNDDVNSRNRASLQFQHVWTIWMDEDFRELRHFLCRSENESKFFKHLLIRCIAVMRQRIERISTAFNHSRPASSTEDHVTSWVERKSPYCEEHDASERAMAIIEQVLQISIESPAFQHFSAFHKWNKVRFQEAFRECNSASTKDILSKTWYEEELESFKGRIDLAGTLRDSRIFRHTADVYLDAVIANRREWEQKGTHIIRDFLSEFPSIGKEA